MQGCATSRGRSLVPTQPSALGLKIEIEQFIKEGIIRDNSEFICHKAQNVSLHFCVSTSGTKALP